MKVMEKMEIHDSLSPAYVKFYLNNNYDALIGLSATINKNTEYKTINGTVTKGDFLNQISPICFKYNLEQAGNDKTSRKLNVYIISNELDNVNKYVKAGSAKKPFYQTEKAAYDYWDKEHKKSWFIEDHEMKTMKISVTARKRNNILYNLRSKIEIVTQLIPFLKNKSIIFANSIDSLLQITPNVISSRNTESVNNLIRHHLDTDKIRVIGSFKKLKQGANLSGLDNCIIMSYYSTSKDFIQRIGRLRDNGEIGNVFIILTKGTQEEIWFSKMFETINNLNLIYCENLKECIQKINK